MSRTVITGATGFLGGALARTLFARGENITACGRNQTALDQLAAEGIPIAGFDLTNIGGWFEGERADNFIHCAARSSPWGRNREFDLANVEGTKNAILLARRLQVKRFVHISTPSLYFRFADQDLVKEFDPLPPPVNAYAASKGKAETLVLGAADLDPVIIRPRGLYGKGDTSLLPRLLRAAKQRPLPLLRGGGAATDITHIDDVVAGVLQARDIKKLSQRVFNISGGVGLPIKTIAEQAGLAAGITVKWKRLPFPVVLAYARAAERFAQIRPSRPEPAITAYGVGLFAFRQTLDISAAAKHLEWQPVVSFQDGLQRTFQAR